MTNPPGFLTGPQAMDNALFTPDARLTPYWWDHVPRPSLPDVEFPRSVDVAIVGSGYTGLHAALQTARGGRHTVVFDAEDAGYGCSTRNGGQISTSVKPTYEMLARRHGPQKAFDIVKEGQRSLEWTGEFVTAERIDCDFGVVGRFHAAHNAAQFEALAKKVKNQPKGLEVDGARRAAFRAAQRNRHRRLLRRRRLRAPCIDRSGTLPPGAPRASARIGRGGHRALPGDRRSKVTAGAFA